MCRPTSGGDAGHMIIDPRSFVPAQSDRYRAAADALYAAGATERSHRRRSRRGILRRLGL